MYTQAKQNNKLIDYFPCIGRYSVTSRKDGLHHFEEELGKASIIIPSLPPPSFCSQLLIFSRVFHEAGYSFGNLGPLVATCPAVSLPVSCAHYLLTGGAVWAYAKSVRSRKGLDAVQVLPINNATIPDLSIFFSADTQI